MIQLRDKDTGANLGSISEETLKFLIDNLEEESEDDKDYFLNRTMLDALKEKGTNQDLLNLLENALGDRDGVEIEWSRT